MLLWGLIYCMATQMENILGETSRFFNVFFDRLNSLTSLLLKINYNP